MRRLRWRSGIAGTGQTSRKIMNANAGLGMVGTHFGGGGTNKLRVPSPGITRGADMSLLASHVRDFPSTHKYYSVREFEHNGHPAAKRTAARRDPTVDGPEKRPTPASRVSVLVTSALRDGMRRIRSARLGLSMQGAANMPAPRAQRRFAFYDTKLSRKGGAVSPRPKSGKRGGPGGGAGRCRHQGRLLLTLPGGRRRRQDRRGRSAADIARFLRCGTSVAGVIRGESAARDPAGASGQELAAGGCGGAFDTIRLWFA